MFVVYSPEGQSFIGAAHNLPALKVDPARRVTESPKTELADMNMEPDHSNPYFQRQLALKQYQRAQKPAGDRHVVVKVAEIMIQPVTTVTPEATITEAWNIMQQQDINHLPVVGEAGLVGICAQGDLLKKAILNDAGELEDIRVSRIAEVMQNQVVTARPETEIRQVAMALTQYHIGALPIVSEKGEVVGIVTLSDLVRRLSQEPPVEIYV
ncbi:CBS domain-containing protein [Thiomicrorhabdus sp. zzn3]|uniref:CBS domain-containing protein n=1 Tax=Thiomicrorhabdus sp. zzn3 TaxID=3039775 RepID=UPI002436FA30|nr:CBS domain-containing protein [Thiomicrorhabdus sp. zzn3]MDG6777784.1 CBS domain-containing protein [Thiomicrorhabdus sp. zzn3]